jgi:DNA-binding NtrC family response regulator
LIPHPAKVLVVDDQPAVAEVCACTLAEAGHSVTTAFSGKEAIAILEVGEIDIVLTDVSMPGMSGMDLLRRFPPNGTTPDFVLMTAYGSVPAAVEAMRLGAYDYILKPFGGDELAMAIGRLADLRHLRMENRRLRLQLDARNGVGGMVGNSAEIVELSEAILRVAGRRQPVLIAGETGTGKELVARAIHQYGPNKNAPFVVVDCGALAEGVIESELFGHARGSFTGALANRSGLLTAAANGTLFLDEIGELSLPSQAKLFRVLQEHEYRPLGDNTVLRFSARIVAATNQDLPAMVKAGTFRQELYYRLNVHSLCVPPLRTRAGDIPLLVEHFIRRHGDGAIIGISPDALQTLMKFPWTGNVRELDNCILTMCSNCDGRVLETSHFSPAFRKAFQADLPAGSPLEEAERETIDRVLESTGGNVPEAARRLGISKATFYRKMARRASVS